MVKFALFTFRSVRVSVFQQRVQSVFRERERGVLLWSESSYDASLRMKKRENEELCCENERNVPHLLQVNNIFVARRLELIGIPPTFSSPTLFSSVVLVEDDDDSASIRSLLGCSDANEESSRVLLSFVVLLLVVVLLLLENGDSETTFQEDGCSSEDDSSDDDAFVVVFLTKERFRRREEEEEEEEEFVDLLLWRRRWSRWCEKTREQWYERDVMFNS